jgi:Spy/CpxP family protein refolding chaperone
MTRSIPFETPAVGLFFSLLLLFSVAPAARAQQPPEQQDEAVAGRRRTQRDGVGLLLQLNLTPEQLARLREIRRESEPEARALGRRLGLARRALDEAIYSDGLNESLVEERVREMAAAQAALLRLRALTELKVRRVLTPEQLRSFRELRRQARERQRTQRRLRRNVERPAAPDARPRRRP